MSRKVEVPEMGESIAEAVILRWMKEEGDVVAIDEAICELETDKATFDLPAPIAGALHRLREVGETVRVGENVAEIDESQTQSKAKPSPVKPSSAKDMSVAAPSKTSPPKSGTEPLKPLVPASRGVDPAMGKQIDGKGGPADAERPVRFAAPPPPPAKTLSPAAGPTAAVSKPATVAPKNTAIVVRTQENGSATPSVDGTLTKPEVSGVHRVPMTKIRRKIAERLVRAQHTAAMLTTFNEVDMTAIAELRAKHKEQFSQKHGVSLGLMSFFAKATVLALKQHPVLNAELDGDDILYHEHVHLAVAVNTERGLVVPVMRNVEDMSFAQFEGEIKRVANSARDGKLSLKELSGGTFTITNGGVFGSLLSTPILNSPQTGILGMHTIQKRPMVVNDQIVARPMMYVALSYDHRLVDGRDAVQFLVALKGMLEDPMKMVLDV